MMHRLIVIEDNQDMADLVCRVGQELDFDTRAIYRPEKIKTLYKEFTPDVIILDILMPEMDGFEVMDFLHNHHSKSHIVVISGQANHRSAASTVADGLKLDIFATLQKPFRIAELRQVLEKVKKLLPAHNPITSVNS